MANAQTVHPLEPFVAVPIGTPEEWCRIIVAFLQDHLRRSGAAGVVVGISGGIDSALTAAMCVEALGRDQVLGLRMPHEESDPEDLRLATVVTDHLGIQGLTRDITPIVEGLEEALGGRPERHVRGNAKARARMMLLYAEAQQRGRLVCGTGNKSELLVGYFTKHGDGGVDLEPLGDLYKTQVWELARHVGLPDEVIDRVPTAGLHPEQTDESELGMAYADLDRVLKGFEMNASVDDVARRTGMDPAAVARVDGMVRRSEHKRHAPLVPKIGARTVGIDWLRSVHWDQEGTSEGGRRD